MNDDEGIKILGIDFGFQGIEKGCGVEIYYLTQRPSEFNSSSISRMSSGDGIIGPGINRSPRGNTLGSWDSWVGAWVEFWFGWVVNGDGYEDRHGEGDGVINNNEGADVDEDGDSGRHGYKTVDKGGDGSEKMGSSEDGSPLIFE